MVFCVRTRAHSHVLMLDSWLGSFFLGQFIRGETGGVVHASPHRFLSVTHASPQAVFGDAPPLEGEQQ